MKSKPRQQRVGTQEAERFPVEDQSEGMGQIDSEGIAPVGALLLQPVRIIQGEVFDVRREPGVVPHVHGAVRKFIGPQMLFSGRD